MPRVTLSANLRQRQIMQLAAASDRDILGAPVVANVDILQGAGIVVTPSGDGVEVSLDPGLASPSYAKLDYLL